MSFHMIMTDSCIVATRTSQFWLLGGLLVLFQRLIVGILFTSQHMTFVMREFFRFITTDFTFVNFWYFLDHNLCMYFHMTIEILFKRRPIVTSRTLEEFHLILWKEKMLVTVHSSQIQLTEMNIARNLYHRCRVIDYLICSR